MNSDDQPPYSMIGVQTTLPGRSKVKSRPIGFIWPEAARRGAIPPRRSPRRNKAPRRGRY